MRTLFVVSGGDAPGINSLIGHYSLLAAGNGDALVGANGGFPGLLENQIIPLTYDLLIPWMGRGGSILPSSRDPVLSQSEAGTRINTVLESQGIDNLVLFGGNGSLRHIPPLLREWGVPCIGIPTTIDNDVPGTEMTLGFDSACNYAYQAIDGAMTTAHALRGRLFMVETLGGTCGNLALAVACGAGAHAVILPEYDYSEAWLAQRLKQAVELYGFGLFIIGEGAKGARTLAEGLPKLTGIRMRDVRLGHAQRGGPPSHRDRVLASEMAQMAYRALKEGATQATLIVRAGQLELTAKPLSGSAIPPDRGWYNGVNGL